MLREILLTSLAGGSEYMSDKFQICYIILCFVIVLVFFFFFQAEDGIRDGTVTGVQTCALPISTAMPSNRWFGWLLQVNWITGVPFASLAPATSRHLLLCIARIRLVNPAMDGGLSSNSRNRWLGWLLQVNWITGAPFS